MSKSFVSKDILFFFWKLLSWVSKACSSIISLIFPLLEIFPSKSNFSLVWFCIQAFIKQLPGPTSLLAISWLFKFLTKVKPVIFTEIAPYLYPEFGYSCLELVTYIEKLNYEFYDENLKKVSNIINTINNIKDGSSENFFLIQRT